MTRLLAVRNSRRSFGIYSAAYRIAAQRIAAQRSAAQHSTAQHRLTSSMSGSFQAPGPANSDRPTVLSRHLRTLSQDASMSAVVLHELAT